MKFPALLHATVLPEFCLALSFADGTQTVVDFHAQLSAPVMCCVASPEAFAKVRVDESGSFMYWDVDVPLLERPDASSDWLYLQSFPENARQRFEADLEQGKNWNEAAMQLQSEFRCPVSPETL
jgi:hypothetical protein